MTIQTGVNVSKANAYASTGPAPGASITKANAYAVMGPHPLLSISKANAYAVVIDLLKPGVNVSKGNSYAALGSPTGVSVSKSNAYVVAQYKGQFGLNVSKANAYAVLAPIPPPPSLYTQQDYANAIRACLPRGKAWPKTPDTVQGMLLYALMGLIEQVDADANALLIDGFPTTTVNLLPEWEATLGLPDPCAGSNPTIQQRQAAVVAHFTETGSETIPALIEYALTLGYTITITPNAPFRIDVNTIGEPINDWRWYFVLTVNGPKLDAVIQCELNSIVSADITLIFG